MKITLLKRILYNDTVTSLNDTVTSLTVGTIYYLLDHTIIDNRGGLRHPYFYIEPHSINTDRYEIIEIL